MIRQTTVMVRHHPVQFLATAKDICTMVAVRIEVTMSSTIRAKDPNIGITAYDYDVAVDYGRDIDVGWHRFVGLFDHNRRRRRWRRQGICDDFIHLVRVDHELALLVGRTSCQKGRTCSRREQNV